MATWDHEGKHDGMGSLEFSSSALRLRDSGNQLEALEPRSLGRSFLLTLGNF